MFLAFREIRRAPARFALLVGAVALLAFLILFQQAIQNALLRSLVGGIENQTAPALVFDVDGRRVPQGSTVTDTQRAAIEALPEVAATAALRQGTFPVAVDGATEAVSVVGYDDAELGGPASLREGRLPSAPGEVVADSADDVLGFSVGDTLVVEPTGLELRIVGSADDIGINGLPTLFTTTETYGDVVRTRNAEAPLPPANVLALEPAAGVSAEDAVDAVNALDGDLDALTRQAAADGNPAVESITQSFTVVLGLFGVVVPLVTGLFFLILTVQKAPSLTLLRAVGAPARRLVSSLLTQVVVVLGAGLALASALYVAFAGRQLDDLVLRVEPSVLVFWIAVLSTLGLLSALAAIRRVLAVDPVVATTGAGR